jgi:Zn ribbon nucleic-acid-binding protein
MQKSCAKCTQKFEITDEDLKFYDKVSPVFAGKKCQIPLPTLCPECRAQRRLAFRNERRLYIRKCDLSGRQILSTFSQEKPYKVYDQKEWWTDKWNAMDYGGKYDLKKPFFEQFHELWKAVPQMNVKGENNENSDYCNLTANCKNCYLVFESSNNEDCLYGYWLQKCNDCCDVSFSHESQVCYETDNCYNCYNLLWSRNCTNCSDSAFLFDCIGCKNCLFCVNQRRKEYCIFNRQYTKEKYREEMKKYRDGSLKNLKDLKNKFREFELKFPHRHAQFVNTENCTGNYIQQGKNCNECFHAHDAEDCKYGEHVWRDSKNNMDVSTVGRHAELVYESINTAIDAHNDLFCIQCWSGTAGLLYCNGCFSCKDCFGCIGLRKKQYCIMNKQYTKEEYQELVRQIIENMRKTGEWGEFFPVSISEYGYNETVAQEQFPLSERGAKKIGAGWKKEDESNKYQGRNVEVPDKISDVSDNIIKEILKCVDCEKNYRIIAKELDFYKKMDIPIPDNCPDCRHSARMKMRNPNRLYRRACTKCSASIGTSYAPDRPEIVYCESCYLKEIY